MAKYNNKPVFFAIVAVGLIVAILGWLLLRRPEVLACCCGGLILGAVALWIAAPKELT